jgi:hypothetical protein
VNNLKLTIGSRQSTLDNGEIFSPGVKDTEKNALSVQISLLSKIVSASNNSALPLQEKLVLKI